MIHHHFNQNMPYMPLRISDSPASTDRQTRIDAEIATCEATIRHLRTRRNADSPISTLPVELLAKIFVLAKMSMFPLFDYSSTEWLNVAGVCRTWREITISTPQMWTFFDMSRIKYLDWAVLLLSRSKDAPLTVECANSLRKSRIINAVVAHIARIKSLEVNSDDSHLLKVFSLQACEALPTATMLQSLKLECLRGVGGDTLMKSVFKIQMPCLQSLYLIGIDLPATIPLLPQLQQLDIFPGVSATLTMASLLSVLRSTPALRELQVFRALRREEEDGDPISHKPVDLPQLSSISLTTEDFGNSSLFHYIRYPASSCVTFNSYVPLERGSSIDMLYLSQLVSRFAASEAAPKIDSLWIENDLPSQLHLKASIADVTVLDISYKVELEQELQAYDFYTMLPLANIRALHISGLRNVTPEQWMGLLKRHEHLRELTTEALQSEFIKILSKTYIDKGVNLPHLKKLTLINHFFDGLVPTHSWGATAAVIQYLQERKKKGVPLEVLEIIKSRVSEGVVIVLEALVGVEWDGRTFSDSEAHEEEEYSDPSEEVYSEVEDSDAPSVALASAGSDVST